MGLACSTFVMSRLITNCHEGHESRRGKAFTCWEGVHRVCDEEGLCLNDRVRPKQPSLIARMRNLTSFKISMTWFYSV